MADCKRLPPSLLYKGYRVSFPGVQQLGHGTDHPPSSSAKVQERVKLYLYYPSGPSCSVLGRTFLYCSEKLLDFVLFHQNINVSTHRWQCHYLLQSSLFLLLIYSVQQHPLVVPQFISSCFVTLCGIPIKVTSEIQIKVTNHVCWTSLPLLLKVLEVHVSFLFQYISYRCIILR